VRNETKHPAARLPSPGQFLPPPIAPRTHPPDATRPKVPARDGAGCSCSSADSSGGGDAGLNEVRLVVGRVIRPMAPLRVMLLRLALLAVAAVTVTAAARPSEVAVGALFTYDSTIGRAARLAIELAVDDVNADRTVLAGTHLNLLAQDTNCSGFLGTIEGWLLSALPVSSLLCCSS